MKTNKNDKNIIFHIDVNSAFLSWSAVRMINEGSKIDLRLVPSIVAGDKEKRHGIVLAKSIPAQKFGIHTAEPIVDAYRKCPNLISVPPDHEYYKSQSRSFINILKEYTPDIEQVSIDECYLDYSGISSQFESPIEAAAIIKNRIRDELGFTVNVGISDRKVLAKMASDFKKPDLIHTLFYDEIQSKMWPLPVGDLFLAGKSTVAILNKLGIMTIGQLAQTPVEIIEYHLKSHGRVLWEYANGIDDSVVKPVREEAKGVGNSTTVSEDITREEDADKVLLWLSEKVAARLRAAHQKAGVVCVEIKYADFTKVSKQKIADRQVSTSSAIYKEAILLFRQLWNGQPVRLLGIRTTKLEDEDNPEQMNLFDWEMGISYNSADVKEISESFAEDRDSIKTITKSNKQIKDLENALDKIKKKYGDNAISRASLMKKNNDDEVIDD